MIVWRICAGRYARESLTGRGAALFSGRWHTTGHPVVYTSDSLALASLEALVHFDRDLVPTGLVQVEIDVPDDLEVTSVAAAALPAGWRRHPAPPRLQEIGDDWLEGEATPVLRVPSAVIPAEANYLLDPRHPGLSRVRIVSTAPFSYDPRLTH